MAALPDQDKIESASPENSISRRISNLGDGFQRISDVGLNPVRTDYTITWVPELIPTARLQKASLLAIRDDVQWMPYDEFAERDFYIESVTSTPIGSYNAQVSAVLREKFNP